MPQAKDLSNQANLHFQTDAIINGGESMKDGKSLQIQIAEAPEAALWKELINWGKYKTSVLGQLAYNAQALARIEGLLVALISAKSQQAEGEAVDYDRINQIVADNVREVVIPEFDISITKKEG